MDIAKFFTLVLLTLLSLSGCQPGTTTTEAKPSPNHQVENPGTTWSVRLDMSGGFAGIHRRLTLDQSGNLQATDINTGHTESDHLGETEVDKIEAQIKQFIASSNKTNPSITSWHCADCIEYRIDATLDDRHYSRVTYSGSPVEPAYTALLNRLSNLLKQTLNQ